MRDCNPCFLGHLMIGSEVVGAIPGGNLNEKGIFACG